MPSFSFTIAPQKAQVMLLQPTGLAQLATKGVLGEVVTTCERSQVRVSRWESVGFCLIDTSIRGWQRLSPGYVL
ncbi:hypothetical protein Tco_0987800 [Tanacetum coccineum]